MIDQRWILIPSPETTGTCPSVVVVAAVLESASCRGSRSAASARNPDNLDLFEVWHICRLPRMLQLQILDLVSRLKTAFQPAKNILLESRGAGVFVFVVVKQDMCSSAAAVLPPAGTAQVLARYEQNWLCLVSGSAGRSLFIRQR